MKIIYRENTKTRRITTNVNTLRGSYPWPSIELNSSKWNQKEKHYLFHSTLSVSDVQRT